MSVLAPPEPPRLDDPEALIREARERQRRRRIRLAAVLALLLASGLGIGFGLTRGGGSTASGRGPFAALSAFAGHGRLAFVSRGSLYVLDGEAGRLVRVTAGGASAPAFSPDGRWLAYAYRGRTGLARADGTHPRRLPAGNLSWLPGGRLLVGRVIYRIAADGTPIHAARAPAGLVGWAPDGSRYAFVTSRDVRGRGGAIHGVTRLEVADSPTDARTTWYSVRDSFARASGWRTPGIVQVVVLPRRRGLLFWLDPMHAESIGADGLAVYELTRPGASPRKLGTTVQRDASLALTGRFALPGGVDRIAWVTKTVLSCRIARCAAVRPPAGALTLDPALSPDGRTLALVSAASEGTTMSFIPPVLKRWYATRRLWVGARAIPDSTGAAAPVWSSDGRSLLFVRDDALWLLPRLDGKPVRVAAPLFGTRVWPNAHGNVPWSRQFAWHS